MVDEEHLALIREGVDAWNAWRRENPDIREANLREANLREADLREADLRGANLSGADLRGADLLKANLREANLLKANLSGANLSGADLRGADLRGADLLKANLLKADLSEADLLGADLRGADLSGANLLKANLLKADLSEADIRGANLREADLRGANLLGANLDEAVLSGTVLDKESSGLESVEPRPDESRRLESVEPQSDEPTTNDQLGRRPFAQALVERMDKLYEKGGQDGFAAHLHAPWGAGKTSILLMMRDLMISDRRSADSKSAPRWIVVQFNAWQHERRNPPWWPLIEAVKTECLRRLSDKNTSWLQTYQAAWIRARWFRWKIKTDALPYVVAIIVGLTCLWLLWSVWGTPGGAVPAFFDWVLKLLTAGIAAYAAFSGASRIAVFGSAASAKFYEDLSQDPLERVTKLFKDIVDWTNMPVCVFIDDLDRCQADYVVDLLGGIQTSFRHKNVAYVVAADRSWIKASFETRYDSFSKAVGNVGQPLGYLFLEKMFQVSTPIPGMGDRIRKTYWNELLKGAALSQETEQFDQTVEAKRQSLRREHGEHLTRDEAEAILKKNDTVEDRAAVVLELNASRAMEKEAEHLLAQFTTIVPDNPRVMKRMVNAFAMRQAIGILERSITPPEVLARWTILEQRFPALADLLIEHPEWTQTLADETQEDRENLPPPLVPFVDSEVIRDIIGNEKNHGLAVAHVQAITRGSAS
jgi:hypothetical protein